jgi:hypothetical protein
MNAADLLDPGPGAGPAPTPTPAPSPAPTPTPTPTPTPSPTPSPTGDWKDNLPDEIKNDPSIKSLKDVAALAKSYIHGQKLIGKDKIIVPDQFTSEDQWKEIYTKLGMPAELDKYDFKAPETTDKEFLKGFKELGHKVGILPKQAEALFGWFEEHANKSVALAENDNKAKYEATVESLKREWGQAYDKKLANAGGMFKEFTDEATRKELRELGFSSHPKVVRLMAQIADKFGDGKFIAPGGNGQMGITPEEAQKKINAVYANKDHAYFHKQNAQHEDARAEMAKLHAAVRAGKK